MSTTSYPPSESPGTAGAIAIRRYVNDEIAATAKRLDPGDGSRFEFICECGDLSCMELVAMTLVDYRVSAPGSVVAH